MASNDIPTPTGAEVEPGHETRSLAGTPATPIPGEETQSHLGLDSAQAPLEKIGRFRILKLLGQGGMGTVYLARDERLDRTIALKVMLTKHADDASAKERFLREARAAARVTNDYVVATYEADEVDGTPFIALQYLQGCSLDAYLKAKKELAIPQILRIGREVAIGLAAAHQLGLIHRDIKPANLWLEAPHGRVKILDFGLAKSIHSAVSAELTAAGTPIGTPAYMSPEQGRGEKVDHRSDLFSLGVVVYRLCTGRSPFQGDSLMARLTSLAVDQPTLVRELNPAVPEPLADLIHQLLSKDPLRRPASASEVAARMADIAALSSADKTGSAATIEPDVIPIPEQDAPIAVETRAAEPTRSSGWRVSRIFFAGVAMSAVFALTALLIGSYIAPSEPPPQFLTIDVGAHNNYHLPIQAFASADSKLLMRHFESAKEAVTRSKELLLAELNALTARTEPQVIHLRAPALVRDDTVYLLPADADPDDDATWIKVNDVLDAIGKCPAQEKLLILDLAQGLVNPRLGVHADRVAETLEAVLLKERPPFLVLCPCSAGQSSLTSEVLGSSVLAYFLDLGLVGAAADADNDGSVSVRELVTFAQSRVDRWARNNRGLQQAPRLFGRWDFVISPVGGCVASGIAPIESAPYPDALLEAWGKRDEARDRGVARQAARLLLRLEACLLRDESRWMGDGAGNDVLATETRALLGELDMLASAPAPRLVSVLGAKENQAAANSLASVLGLVKDPKAARAMIAKTLQEDKNADYPQQARTIVDAMSRLVELTRLEQVHLKEADAALAGLRKAESLVEVHYLQRLAEFSEREFAETFEVAQVKVIWQTMREHEAVLAALARGPEFLPWVASAIETADMNRRAGERKLLWKRPLLWPQGTQELKSSGATYSKVKKTLDAMQAGSAALDRALDELPVHLRILCDGPDADPQDGKTWLKAVEEAVSLQEYLGADADKRDAEVQGGELEKRGRNLQEHLDELMRSFRRRIKTAEKAKTATAQRQIRWLIQSPHLRAAERADLFKTLRREAVNLHLAVATNDQPAATAAERYATVVRAEMSFALLRVAGIEPRDSQPFKDLGSLSAMEKRLHQLWGASGLVRRWNEAPGDRHERAISALVSPWDRGPVDAGWRRKARATHLNWLQLQYEAESRDTGPDDLKADDPRDQAIRELYGDVAQELRAHLGNKK